MVTRSPGNGGNTYSIAAEPASTARPAGLFCSPTRSRSSSVTSIAPPIMPPAVRDGDLVGVVAPAGPITPERLKAGLDRLAPHLTLRVPEGVTSQTGYLAGSD